MKLSIIILNYNTEHLLRLCLKNLFDLNINIDHEIIVVDNASTDNSVAVVKEKYSAIKLIESKKNIGHAAGNNLGIKHAKGEYVLILNSDIIFTQLQDIKKVLDFLDSHPRVGIVGPKLLNGDGTVQRSCYRPYGFMTPMYRRTPLGKLGVAKKDLQRHLMWDFEHNETREVEWVLGACMFIRKDFLERQGFFDERFFLYFADYELCDRAKLNKYQVYYFAETNIIHYHKRESAKGSVWGGVGSLFNYTTRIHLKDWFKYLAKKRKYEKEKS